MVQATMAAFAGDVLRPSPDLCSVERNLGYGEHERQRLDLFCPVAAPGAPRPVLIFVHGGGFIGGDKGAPDAPFFNNIGAWAAQHGFIGVTMTYRLAPAAAWPAGSDDVASAVNFLRGRCATYGGNPDSIFVMGQSAGAAHVAGYVAHARYGAVKAIAGAILMSGIYDLELGHSPLEEAYYGTDADRFAKQSSVKGLAATRGPCLFSIAELDPDNFHQQTGQVIKAYLAAHGRLPLMQYHAGHNHVSPALQIGGNDDAVGPAIAEFIERFAPQ
jgi:acetyl esterase/lipase